MHRQPEMICIGTRGRGLHLRKSSRAPPQEVNGRVTYLYTSGSFCFAPQRSLSLTPGAAGRKRQASRYRSGHSLRFACDGLPSRCFMPTPIKKASQNKKVKPRRTVVNTSVAEQAQTIAELRQQLAESLQRENGTAKELQDCK